MFTKDEIRKKLKNDPNFELPHTATDQEWDWYDEIVKEVNTKIKKEGGFDCFDEYDWGDDDYKDGDSWDK